MIPREEFNGLLDGFADLATRRHAEIVEGLIKWLQPEVVVEVGVAFGYMSARIARALQEAGHKYRIPISIDSFAEKHADPDELCSRWNDAGLTIDLRIGDSQTVLLPDRVDMAVIDGHHDVDPCWIDVRRAVLRGASCICLHDTMPEEDCHDCPGPSIALARLNAQGWQTFAGDFDRGFGVALRL